MPVEHGTRKVPDIPPKDRPAAERARAKLEKILKNWDPKGDKHARPAPSQSSPADVPIPILPMPMPAGLAPDPLPVFPELPIPFLPDPILIG